MRRLKVFGALLSAAALAVTMPMTAFASVTDTVETIDTSGWVQVSNALPQKGDVISMKISLPANSDMKGISGVMKSVTGAVPVHKPGGTVAPSATTAPTQPPAASATQTPKPSATQTETPSNTPSATQTAAPSVPASEEVSPSATQSPAPTPTPDDEQEPSGSGDPATEPSESESTGSSDAGTTPSSGDQDENDTPSSGQEGDDNQNETPNPSAGEESEQPSASAGEATNEPTETSPVDNADETEEPDTSASADADQTRLGRSREADDGWTGLLSEEEEFIVLSPAPEANSAERYFQVTAEPGEAVTFEFSGRYSDGKGDHRFVATHRFQVADASSRTTKQMSVNTGSVRTVDGSDLEFRLWPSDVTTIEGVRPTSSVQAGTSPGELLRNLKMPNKTTARVYRGETNVPRLSGVCTGDTIRFKSRTARGADDEAVAVVRGDLLGTGKLSLNQLVAMSKTLAGQVPLDEANLLAADVNGDGKVTPADATALKKLVRGRK